MEIKILDRTEKPKKATSVKNLKMPDDKIDLFRRLACDLYVLSNNMVLSHDMYRRVTLGGEYGELASANANAMAFFTKPENANYVAARKLEFYKFGFDEYCRIKNIEHAEFKEIENKAASRNISKTPAEVREETLIDLQKIIDNPNSDDQTLLAAIKQRTEITDAKYKDKGQDLLESEKMIHYYLPANICDKCPHKTFIEDQYKDLPDVDLEL
jgi:hypothetical protein